MAGQGNGSSGRDLSGGMAPDADPPLLRQPQGQLGFGENHAFWISGEDIFIYGHLNTQDGAGAFDLRHGSMRVLLANGRRLVNQEDGGHTREGVAASAQLSFHCDAPFQRWTVSFRGVMRDASIGDQFSNGPPSIVDFTVECDMAAPPWVNGAFTPGGLGPVEAFMGGHRYEQLFRAKARISIDGQEKRFDAHGNRTHRRGVRAFGVMLGHCWGAAIFPNGEGFGYQIYPDADGGVLWDEGYLVRDGQLVPARVTGAPWLRTFNPAWEKFVTEFDVGGERVVVQGEILGTTAVMMIPGKKAADDVILAQSWARYTWNGQTTCNMLERSLRRSEINKGSF
jgi:hypothetical protein